MLLLIGLVILGVVAFLTFVMANGKPASPSANLTYLGIVIFNAFMLAVADTTSTRTPGGGLAAMTFTISVFGLPVFLLLNIKALARGWNYLFVEHPVEPIVSPALRSGQAIDSTAVAETLAAGAQDQGAHPAYHYENQAKKARALTRDLEADALRKQEAARAELEEADRQLEAALRRGGRS